MKLANLKRNVNWPGGFSSSGLVYDYGNIWSWNSGRRHRQTNPRLRKTYGSGGGVGSYFINNFYFPFEIKLNYALVWRIHFLLHIFLKKPLINYKFYTFSLDVTFSLCLAETGYFQRKLKVFMFIRPSREGSKKYFFSGHVSKGGGALFKNYKQ